MNINYLDISRFKTCSCGVDVNSESCKAEYQFSLVGWFFWTMGTTATPKKIKFTCLNCNKMFESIEDKKLIKHYTLYRKK